MSLEELRALAEQEESQETTEVQEELELEAQDESEEEAETADAENEEPEELDELDLELEGEPEPKPKFDAKAALTHKLTKQRKRAQKAESEVDSLRKEIDQLKQAMNGQAAPQAQTSQPAQTAPPEYPDLWSAEINGDRVKHNEAMVKDTNELIAYNQTLAAPQQQAEKQQSDYQESIARKATLLSEDAVGFIQENKIKAEKVTDAIEVAKQDVDEAAGLDGAFVHLLGSLDDGAAKVAYHLGRNEAARDKLKSLIKNDPSGLKAVSYLTKLTNLKPKTKVLSKAPDPDEPVKGNANSVTAERLQSMYDKETDMTKMVAMRKTARSMGINLN